MRPDGMAMPEIGFGTWKLPAGDACREVVLSAIGAGFRYLDTAAAYLNEASVGQAIAEAGDTHGVRRRDLFVSGKLWNSKWGYDKAKRACIQTLKRLGVDYLDLYLIHWPSSSAFDDEWRETNLSTWRGLESLLADGYVRAIGVCNFLPHHLDALLERAIVAPAVDQVEFHPGCFAGDVSAYCREKGIGLGAWSPLGHGELLSHPIVQNVAERSGCSPAQACLAWASGHGAVPVVKATGPDRMLEDLLGARMRLPQEEMGALDAMPEFAHSGMLPDQVNDFG